MKTSWSQFPYSSHRTPLFATNVVSTSQPLAAQAGIQMLQKGGNAADAAIATAIALTVVEPTSNGIGSDAFALIWDGTKLHGLNGSGRSPAGWTLDRFRHLKQMPRYGWDSVTVPGAISAWVALHERFGRLDFKDLFGPAVRYASEGFIVAPRQDWPQVLKFPHSPDLLALFAPSGKVPKPGELFVPADMAETLQEIAQTKGESFYRGRLAEKIAEASRSAGGAMTEQDLGENQATWVDPIATEYRDGVSLHEIPPNGQGLAALIALGILRHLDLAQYEVDSADSIHLQIEAMKIGFAIAHSQIADPEHMKTPAEAFLDDLEQTAKTINLNQALRSACELPHDKGTVYLTAADAGGMMVSFIQSNYMGFGSGVVVPGTGISLQNRGHGFRIDKDHPNCVGPSKLPYHTIIPGFVMKTGAPPANRQITKSPNHQLTPVMSFGVMGGHHQPQGHLQVMVRTFDYHQNPQASSTPQDGTWTNQATSSWNPESRKK